MARSTLSASIQLSTDMKQNIKEGLEGRPASWYSDVFDLAFHNLDKERASKLWQEQLKKTEKKKSEDD
jgi:Lon-like ATP-dependent protease